MVKKLLLLTTSTIILSCQNTSAPVTTSANTLALLEKSKQLQLRAEKVENSFTSNFGNIEQAKDLNQEAPKIADDKFVDLSKLSNRFIFDMKYATKDNFLEKAVYPCERCFVKGKVAKALLAAQQDFLRQGYRIKFYDCYRPHSVQKQMWKIFPDPGYVADPKGGSVHNRGAAVDITLTDLKGNELNMGTDFDHFGKEASHSYKKHPEEVLANRKLLRSTLEKHGFETINSEWWHYNYKGGKKYKVSNFVWSCN